jgi:ATP-dependent Clp protease ATP-binding subunit ClpA
MFERFTDRARKVMALASQEAQRCHHDHVGTEHILLGLLKEGTGIAAMVLQQRGLQIKVLRQHIADMVTEGMVGDETHALPQTVHAKHVLTWAVEEARTLHHNYLGTEHLLLALLRETDGVAGRMLLQLGLQLEDLRRDVLQRLGESAQDDGHLGPLPPEAAHTAIGAQLSASATPAGRIKHIVMWRLPGEGAGKQDQIQQIKTRLEALRAQVKEIRYLEVGINQAQGNAACDIALVSEFANAADLESYRRHPAHQEALAFIRTVVSATYVVDYPA